MADRELEIRLRVDRQAAAQAAQEELRDLTRVREAHRQADQEKQQGSRRAAESATRESRQSTDAQVRDVHRLRDERGRFVSQAIAGDKQLADNAVRSWGQIGGGIGNATSLLSGYAAQMTGLNGMRSILQGIREDWERIAEAQGKAGEAVTDRRGSIRQLAALKGQAGETLKTEVEQLQLRQVTLQSRDEAMAMELGMVGTGDPMLRSGRIKQDQFTRLAEHVGSFQAMTGYDATKLGGFAGLMPKFLGATEDNPLQADQAFGEMAKVIEALQMSGAPADVLMDQMTQALPLLTSGAFSSFQQMGGMFGAIGTTSGTQTGQRMDQLVRATVGSAGKMRNSAMMADLTDEDKETRGEYLLGLGWKEGMDVEQVGDLIADDLDAKKAEAAAVGRAFDQRLYLAQKGYGGNIQDMDALFEYADNRAEYKSTYKPLVEGPADLAGVHGQIAKFQRTDPFAIKQRAAVSEEMADVMQGAGGPELANQMMRSTFERMRASGEVKGTFEAYTGGVFGPARLNELAERAAFDANQQLPPEMQDWGVGGIGGMLDPGARARRLGQLGMSVIQQGGTPGGDWAGQFGADGIGQVVGAIERQTQMVQEEQQQQQQRRAARRGPPPPPPMLPPDGPRLGGAPLR